MHSSDTYSGEGFVNAVKAVSNVRIWLLLLSYVAGGARLCPVQAGIAGGDMSSTVRLPAVEAEDSQVIHEHSSSKASDKTTSDQKSEEDQKSEKKDEKDKKKKESAHSGSFVVAPLPIVSPALGSGIIPVMGYITPIPAKDRGLTPSVVGAGGLITDNGTRGFGLGAISTSIKPAMNWSLCMRMEI